MATSSWLVPASGLFALVVSGCGSTAQGGGPCEGANPAPECSLPCDPAPAAPNGCPTGFHCAPDGECTAVCSPAGGCGSQEVCTTDGRCLPANIDASPQPDADCPDVRFQAMRVTPTVQVLLDQSGSMDSDFGGPTRYEAVRDALVGPMGVITDLEASAYFGATLYYAGNSCPTLTSVSTGRVLNNAGAIRTLLNGNGPESGTPTGESLRNTYQEMLANPAPAGSPSILVLATDGEPDMCADGNDINTGRATTVTNAQAAFAAGIRVFVLSVGTGVANSHLQEVANAGVGLAPNTGPPNAAPYYVANSPAALTAAFESIIGGVVSCELDLDGSVQPDQGATGTVTLNGNRLTFGTDWELVDGNTIRLLGAACAMLNSTTNPQVSASFPCGSIVD